MNEVGVTEQRVCLSQYVERFVHTLIRMVMSIMY